MIQCVAVAGGGEKKKEKVLDWNTQINTVYTYLYTFACFVFRSTLYTSSSVKVKEHNSCCCITLVKK
jgi:hypothetical protein